MRNFSDRAFSRAQARYEAQTPPEDSSSYWRNTETGEVNSLDGWSFETEDDAIERGYREVKLVDDGDGQEWIDRWDYKSKRSAKT
jgi:hypothetical protein